MPSGTRAVVLRRVSGPEAEGVSGFAPKVAEAVGGLRVKVLPTKSGPKAMLAFGLRTRTHQ